MASSLLRQVSEAEFQADIEKLCTLLGLMAFHVHRSDKGRVNSKGFPDLVIVGNRTIFAELKKEDGRQSEAQKLWEFGLRNAGAEFYLWRPSDMPQIAKILQGMKPGSVNINS